MAIRWVKSSQSFSNGNCTEVAAVPGAVLVRDSKDPDGPHLAFGGEAWRQFLGEVKRHG